MICTACGEPAVISKRYEDMCQFHWDCTRHEVKIRLDAIRDFGQYHHGNCGPNFGVTYYGYMQGSQYAMAGYSTLSYGLLASNYPREAMDEARRIAARNGWKLLKLDVQGGVERRLGLRTCANLYVSEEYQTYMKYSDLKPLAYDEGKYGVLTT